MKFLHLVLLAGMSIMPRLLMAQSQTSQTLGKLKAWSINIANVLFIILLVFGIIRVVKAFIEGNPKAVNYLVYLIVGGIVFFAFSALVGDFQGLGGIEKL